jgi:hypothetical protein
MQVRSNAGRIGACTAACPPRQSERKGKVTNPTAVKLEGRDRSRKPRPADQASPSRHGEMEVARLRITDAGRKALAEAKR